MKINDHNTPGQAKTGNPKIIRNIKKQSKNNQILISRTAPKIFKNNQKNYQKKYHKSAKTIKTQSKINQNN